MTQREYKSFKQFYPFYLSQHMDGTCRILHFCGTFLFFVILIAAISTQTWWLLALLPVVGYGFAWAGHFFFEKNKPATFTYPLWSLASDFVMFFQILAGKEKINPNKQVNNNI